MMEAWKETVLEISRLAEKNGLCQPGGGNFSQLDRESGQLVITPHAAHRSRLAARDLLVMDLEGNLLENRGGLIPSSETPMHLYIYRNRPDIGAVCHTHAPNAAVFACLGLPVKPVVCQAAVYGGVCRVVPYAPPGSTALARHAVEGLQGTYATILGKHGLVTIGGDLHDAYLKSIYVEELCQINLRAAALVGYEKLESLSLEQLQAVGGAVEGPG